MFRRQSLWFWHAYRASGEGSIETSVIFGVEHQAHPEQCSSGFRGLFVRFCLGWVGAARFGCPGRFSFGPPHSLVRDHQVPRPCLSWISWIISRPDYKIQ
jgi:hypothetical protein